MGRRSGDEGGEWSGSTGASLLEKQIRARGARPQEGGLELNLRVRGKCQRLGDRSLVWPSRKQGGPDWVARGPCKAYI